MTHTCQFVPVEIEYADGVKDEDWKISSYLNAIKKAELVLACSCGRAKKKPLTWVEDK